MDIHMHNVFFQVNKEEEKNNNFKSFFVSY